MSRVLDLLARPATRAPRATLLALVLVTTLFGGLATQLVVSTDLDDFAPEGGAADTLDAIDARFTSGRSFQVLVDAGAGGDVLTSDALAAGLRLQEALRDDEVLAPLLAPDGLDRPAVLTYAEPFRQGAELFGGPLDELDDASAELLVEGLLADADGGAFAAALLSGDLELDPPRARAGLVLVELAAGTDNGDLAVASDAVERVAADVAEPGLRVSVLSEAAIQRAIDDGIQRDIPLLTSLSLLLVLSVLAWLFRSVSDVAVALAGLLASIVWMVGAAALVGPGMLDLAGPFGQTAIAVPVLLVGLGVDYSVHLTTRYREQQRAGDAPDLAATTALRTVGVALVLATAATVGGFLSNLATPVPPIADLGIFASLGIVAAFVVFGLAVPATRTLLDRRVGARAARDAGAGARPGRWTTALTTLAVRRPAAILTATAVALVVAGFSALGLGTEFDERDFLPEGTAITATIDRIDQLFGGDVGEQTFVVIDGDTTDPDLLAEAAVLQDRLAQVPSVRTVGDRPQITSPFELVDRLGDRGARARAALAADLDGWADPDGAAADLELPDQIAPETIEASLDGAVASELPDDLLDELRRRLPPDRSPEAALATTGDPETVRAAARDQRRDELIASRPDVPVPILIELASLPEEQLTPDALDAAGLPRDAVDDDDRAALVTLASLEDAGWDLDDPSRAPADVAAQLEVVRADAADELRATATDDGLLLVASTTVGEDGAAELAAEIDRLARDLRDAGAEVTVASQPLVNAEIIDGLSSAQLAAIAISIAIAGLLLVGASLWSDRSVVLGLIGVAPTLAALLAVLGTMRAVGLSFNALTATVASIAVGIGVPYGIHLTNRFRASLRRFPDVTTAIDDTLRNTGGALVGSAVTTGLAFAVLGLSSSVPLRQFGLVAAMMIGYALVACLVLQPTLLALWARRRLARAPLSSGLRDRAGT